MISAKVIADSIAPHGRRITTFELEFPRFILAELNTHRALSKNAASSRAIPAATTIKQIQDDPAMPVFWGKNQAGMSAKEELSENEIGIAQSIWLEARDNAIRSVRQLIELGLHKQIANRMLEPWVMIKVVVTGTDDGLSNLYHLRRHKDAQPEFKVLADAMYDAQQASTPVLLNHGQWHLPYVGEDFTGSLEEGRKLSASLCAQLSYRKADESLDKAIAIYDRLVTSEPVHASPFEHQATPSHDKNAKSGNLTGFIQHRSLIPNNVCTVYEP